MDGRPPEQIQWSGAGIRIADLNELLPCKGRAAPLHSAMGLPWLDAVSIQLPFSASSPLPPTDVAYALDSRSILLRVGLRR